MGSPGKSAPRPSAKDQKIDQDHHDHEAHAPSEHHVDARLLEPVGQLLANASARAERLGDNAIFHDKESDIRNEEKI